MRDDAERGETALHRRGFADPVEPVLAPHPDKGAALLRLVLRRPGDLKRLDLGDFHDGIPPTPVIPAEAGIHGADRTVAEMWVPACAGMTNNGCAPAKLGTA